MEVFQNGGTPANQCKSSIFIWFRCSIVKTSILWNPHCRKPPNDCRMYSMKRSDDGPNLPQASHCIHACWPFFLKWQSHTTCQHRHAPFLKNMPLIMAKVQHLSQQFFLGGKQSVIPTQCRSSFARIRSNKCGKNLTRTYPASHLQQESHMQQTRRTIW